MPKKRLYLLLLLLAGIAITGMTGKWLFESGNSQIAPAETVQVAEHAVLPGADWCSEHRVPESQCTQCHPELIAEYKKKNDWCVEHVLPESHCRLCHPGLTFPQEPLLVIDSTERYVEPSVFLRNNKSECATNNAIIQFVSAKTAERAGLETEPVITFSQSYSFESPGELIYDETKTVALTTVLPTMVVRWLVELGSPVQVGTPIAQLESLEMAQLQADYLQALAESSPSQTKLTRADSMRARQLISQAEYEEIESEARSRLNRLNGLAGELLASGFSQDDLEHLQKEKKSSSRWLLRAPVAGALIERKAQIGVRLEEGEMLAMTGDPSKVWIEAHVPEREASRITTGQHVEFSTDGSEFGRIAGKLFWIAQFVEPQTRTITVRAEVLTTDAHLLANRFGTIRFAMLSDAGALSIPKDAVQWEGCCNVVFVEEAVGHYRPRKVALKQSDREHYQVISGVTPGEMVVVKGSFLLKTELMKTSLGAGCCAVAAH